MPKVTIKIELPSKEDVDKFLSQLVGSFGASISIEVEKPKEEKPSESVAEQATTEET